MGVDEAARVLEQKRAVKNPFSGKRVVVDGQIEKVDLSGGRVVELLRSSLMDKLAALGAIVLEEFPKRSFFNTNKPSFLISAGFMPDNSTSSPKKMTSSTGSGKNSTSRVNLAQSLTSYNAHGSSKHSSTAPEESSSTSTLSILPALKYCTSKMRKKLEQVMPLGQSSSASSKSNTCSEPTQYSISEQLIEQAKQQNVRIISFRDVFAVYKKLVETGYFSDSSTVKNDSECEISFCDLAGNFATISKKIKIKPLSQSFQQKNMTQVSKRKRAAEYDESCKENLKRQATSIGTADANDKPSTISLPIVSQTSKSSKPKGPVPGFCEVCHARFEDLEVHILENSHLKNLTENSTLATLNRLYKMLFASLRESESHSPDNTSCVIHRGLGSMISSASSRIIEEILSEAAQNKRLPSTAGIIQNATL